ARTADAGDAADERGVLGAGDAVPRSARPPRRPSARTGALVRHGPVHAQHDGPVLRDPRQGDPLRRLPVEDGGLRLDNARAACALTLRLSRRSTGDLKGVPMLRTRILGTGFVTGENLVKNEAIAGLMDTSDQWIRERSGVEQRYYVEKGTTTSDLGLGAARKALDDGGEAPSAEEKAWITRFRDRTVLFGDAGGACVLRGAEGERGLLGFQLHSDGKDFQSLYVPACGFAQRPYVSESDLREGRHIPEMNGKHVFKQEVTRMPQVVREGCSRNGVEGRQLDLLIAHQANLRINEMVQRALELPDEK